MLGHCFAAIIRQICSGTAAGPIRGSVTEVALPDTHAPGGQLRGPGGLSSGREFSGFVTGYALFYLRVGAVALCLWRTLL